MKQNKHGLEKKCTRTVISCLNFCWFEHCEITNIIWIHEIAVNNFTVSGL